MSVTRARNSWEASSTNRRCNASAVASGRIACRDVIVLLVIVLLAELLAPLPRTVLSAIVIQAVWGLMDTAALKRYRWIRRNDFISAIAAMIGVLLFGPLYGLLIAIGQALLGLVYRFSRIDLDVMGRVPDEKAAWGSIRNHPERRTYDGIVVVRRVASPSASSARWCGRTGRPTSSTCRRPCATPTRSRCAMPNLRNASPGTGPGSPTPTPADHLPHP